MHFWATHNTLRKQYALKNNEALFLFVLKLHGWFRHGSFKGQDVAPIIILFEDGMLLWRTDDLAGSARHVVLPTHQNTAFEYGVFFLSEEQLQSLLDTLESNINISIRETFETGFSYIGLGAFYATFYLDGSRLSLWIPPDFLLDDRNYSTRFHINAEHTLDQKAMTRNEYVVRCRKMFSSLLDTVKTETEIFANLKVVRVQTNERGHGNGLCATDVIIECSNGLVFEKTYPCLQGLCL